MRLDVSQHLRLEQRMKLAPRIIQAMEILQLPLMAIQERIEEEMNSNPVLEMRIGGSDQPAGEESSEPAATDNSSDRGERAMVVDDRNTTEDFRRLAQFEDEYGGDFAHGDSPPRAAFDTRERDRKLDALANTPAPDISLIEYLQEQWMFVEATDEIKQAGAVLINYIDADGYLRTPLEEIAASAAQPPIPLNTLKDALKLVQTLDPIGVGARDLKECLLIQLAVETLAGNEVTLETELVRDFLRDIEMNRLPLIAKRMDRSIDQIKRAIENLARLSPRPGSLIGNRSAPAVAPDVVVTVNDEGEVVVTMPDGNTPRLYISKAYQKMVRNRQTDRTARKFIQQNIRSAQWLIGAIQQRRETIRRVTEEVFKVQRDFLDRGDDALKPLPMMDVANKVGIHVATVSRAVSGKYVQTQRGIFPLRMFFSGGTTTSQGQDVSWDAVKSKLKELVDAEDKAKPLNDDQLADEMKKQGIDIARRTVAKYRDLLEIPPARKRKQY